MVIVCALWLYLMALFLCLYLDFYHHNDLVFLSIYERHLFISINRHIYLCVGVWLFVFWCMIRVVAESVNLG